MTNNDELAMKLKSAAEKASGGEWVRESGEGWEAICSDDDRENGGFIICSFQGNDDESNRKFVQGASPANILALLAERDADKKVIADYRHQLSRYSMSPGEADQRRCESRAVRDALGFGKDADNVAPVDLREKISVLRQRIDELEARTVSVKLPDNTQLSEAPEHIWLQTAGEWPATGEFSELTWCSDRQHPDDTLYVRADLAAGIKLEVGE